MASNDHPQSPGDFDVERIKAHSRAAGVHPCVYASVGSAHRETGIPHFENKARVEERVRERGEFGIKPTRFAEWANRNAGAFAPPANV